MCSDQQAINAHSQFITNLHNQFQQGNSLEKGLLILLATKYMAGDVLEKNVDSAAKCYLSLASDEVNIGGRLPPAISLGLVGIARKGSLVALEGVKKYASELEDRGSCKFLAESLAIIYTDGIYKDGNEAVAPDAEEAAYWREIAFGGHVGAAPAPVAGDYVGGVVKDREPHGRR